MRMHIRPLAAAIIVMVLIAGGGARANAQEAGQEPPPGAELVIFNGSAGPYDVRISQSPARAVLGSVRIVVEPVDAETGLPVENALVRVFGTSPEGGERQYSPGLNSPSNRSLYFGQVVLEDEGVWTIDVEIDSPLGRSIAIAQTTIHGRARSSNGALVGTALFALVTGGFAGGGVWLWYSSKTARKRRDLINRDGGSPRNSPG